MNSNLNFLLGLEIAEKYVYGGSGLVDVIFEQSDYWIRQSKPNTGIYIVVKHGDEAMVDANMATAHYNRVETIEEMKYLYNQEFLLIKKDDMVVDQPSFDSTHFDYIDTPDYGILYLYK